MPSKGTTSERGYGPDHRKLRKQLEPLVASGQAICWRCSRRLKPGQKWDLGHADEDRTIYRGPEHALARDCPAGGNRAVKRADRTGKVVDTPVFTGQLHVIIGPPAGGKSTYVREHAKPGDITIDYDALAHTLSPHDGNPHDHPGHIRSVTKAARQAAIDTALTLPGSHDVWIIHSWPNPALLTDYINRGANVVVVDPGPDVVLARCKTERPYPIQQAAKQWYDERASKAAAVIEAGPTHVAEADTSRQW